MSLEKPVVIFDTSALNKLADDTRCNLLTDRIVEAYSVILTGSSVSEIVACPELKRRNQLFGLCQRLLKSGACSDPFFFIIEKHVTAHAEAADTYNWNRVPVRNLGIERRILQGAFLCDDLADRERESTKALADEFDRLFAGMRTRYEAAFKEGMACPSLRGMIEILRSPGGQLWTGYAQLLYERYARYAPDPAVICDFATKCPPFMMILLAVLAGEFHRAVTVSGKKRRAGRIDILSATYVPYCQLFVTKDCSQEQTIREIVQIAPQKTEILSWSDFLDDTRTCR